MPFVDAQQTFDDDYPDGLRYYWKSLNLTRLDDEVIERIVAHARRAALAAQHDRHLAHRRRR